MEWVEKRVREIEADLRFCEKLLRKEARMDLAKRILEELMKQIRELTVKELPGDLRAKVLDMGLKIRILYHRANALLSLQEE